MSIVQICCGDQSFVNVYWLLFQTRLITQFVVLDDDAGVAFACTQNKLTHSLTHTLCTEKKSVWYLCLYLLHANTNTHTRRSICTFDSKCRVNTITSHKVNSNWMWRERRQEGRTENKTHDCNELKKCEVRRVTSEAKKKGTALVNRIGLYIAKHIHKHRHTNTQLNSIHQQPKCLLMVH